MTLRQKHKGVTRVLSLCLIIQRVMSLTPLSLCLSFIVNEKTTSNVLSKLLLIIFTI